MDQLEKVILLEKITSERIKFLSSQFEKIKTNEASKDLSDRFRFYFIRDLLAVNFILNERSKKVLSNERIDSITH
jgi:hypothetical protein